MKEARKLLGWSESKLTVRGHTTKYMVAVYEQSGRLARSYNMHRDRSDDPLGSLRTALEAAGVVFTNGDEPGVKLRKAAVVDAG